MTPTERKDNLAWHEEQRTKLAAREQRRRDEARIQYETVRGVSYPVEPGMSPLQRTLARKKALKRMRVDDRKLANLQASIAQAKRLEQQQKKD